MIDDPSEDLLEFLDFLGTKVPLKNFENFRGGLDVSEKERDGKYSVYTNYEDYEIMFHVSTYMTFSSFDEQQIERKRHIGNDVVVIIFKEGDSPFNPVSISSHFNHVFIVIKKNAKKNIGK